MHTTPLGRESTSSGGAVPLAWETELFLLAADDRDGLARRANELAQWVERVPSLHLTELAASLASEFVPQSQRLAVVAGTAVDLVKRLRRAAERISDPATKQVRDSQGVYFFSEPLGHQGAVALLFPGESSQYLNMFADVADHFPEVAATFAWCDQVAVEAGVPERSITRVIFAPHDLTAEERAERERRLHSLANSIFAVSIVDLAMFRVLEQLQVPFVAMAGHSVGEMAALIAAGAIPAERMSGAESVDTMDAMQAQEDAATGDYLLLATGAGPGVLAEIAGPEVVVAMDNCPHQSVVVGPLAVMLKLEEALKERSILFERLPFRRPYHTEWFAPWLGPFHKMFESIPFSLPSIPVYTGSTGAPFPHELETIRAMTVENWARPVHFTATIQNLYDDGVRLFVEAGPRGNLSAFVEDTLRGKSFAALPCNLPKRSGLTQINHVVGQLVAHHVPVNVMHLFSRRVNIQAMPTEPDPLALPVDDDVRTQVMHSYLDVMEQFLATQQTVMSGFMSSAPVPTLDLPTLELPTLPAPKLYAMLGKLVDFHPGVSLISRRVMSLDEDLFVHDHTIGGRAVSRVDPSQNGLPILPATFSVEVMSEVACTLLPGMVVTSVEGVKLFRWLPYDAESTTLEANGSVLPDDGTGKRKVKVSVRDLGNRYDRGVTSGMTAAEGVVVLDSGYPAAPLAVPLEEASTVPCQVTPEVLYRNLFHGPAFQGVEQLTRWGARGIEGIVDVPRRDTWFVHDNAPSIVVDPVLIDAAMHLLGAWHLEQPDWTGRILLPFELRKIEFFGPMPEVGTRLYCRGLNEQESARHFRHGLEIGYPDGTLWARLSGVGYWRFYLPFGQVNFFGPKDEYYLCRAWDVALPPGAERVPARCYHLNPPMDLRQVVLRAAGARVTMTQREIAEYDRLTLEDAQINDWLFSRIVAKDAARSLWSATTGENLFPADIDLQWNAGERPVATRRDGLQTAAFPTLSVAQCEGVVAALAAYHPYVGITLDKLAEDAAPDVAQATRTRAACQAVRIALSMDDDTDCAGWSVANSPGDASIMEVTLPSDVRSLYPDISETVGVKLVHEGDILAATSLCLGIA